MTETPAEQRLRALITERQRWLGLFSDSPEAGNYAETTAAIDLGREALALWVAYLRAVEGTFTEDNVWTGQAAMLVAQEHVDAARALLARARSVA